MFVHIQNMYTHIFCAICMSQHAYIVHIHNTTIILWCMYIKTWYAYCDMCIKTCDTHITKYITHWYMCSYRISSLVCTYITDMWYICICDTCTQLYMHLIYIYAYIICAYVVHIENAYKFEIRIRKVFEQVSDIILLTLR